MNVDKEVLSSVVKISLATRRAIAFGGRGGFRGRGGGGFRGRGRNILCFCSITISMLSTSLGGGGGDFGGYRGRG